MARPQHAVAVIGGGVAGLVAAQEIGRAGLSVVVLESRDRLGGRIDTCTDFSACPIELGAEFVHGRPPILRRLLKEARAHLDSSQFDPLVLQGGRRLKERRAFGKVFEELRRSPATDLPFGERIRSWTGDEARLARQFVEGYMAADVERVSSQALAEEEQAADQISGDEASRVREGYATLVRFLARKLPRDSVRLACRVQSVDWKRGRVELSSSGPDGFERPTMVVERALFTVPLGVWQQQPIPFHPPVDEKRSAARKLGMGAVVKTFLRLRVPLSQVSGLSRPIRRALNTAGFIIVLGGAVPTWWTVGPPETPVLVGWAGGPAGQRMSDLSPPAMTRTAIETLAAALGTTGVALASVVDGVRIADWQKAPFSFGAYSWVPVGARDLPGVLAKPVGDTLFFAGEATDQQGHRGTVHGALESGLRAAREIIDSFR